MFAKVATYPGRLEIPDDALSKEPAMGKTYNSAPAMTIDSGKTYTATFETTRGSVVVELFADRAPVTVNNFVFLANEGFYNGIVFHRVIADFMIQGGDPTGTGRGDAGYKWKDEQAALAIKHEKGTLSMANAGPNTNGSQFFITHVATPHLNGKHAVFGKVKSGQEIVDMIRQGDTIKSITIGE